MEYTTHIDSNLSFPPMSAATSKCPGSHIC